jgi:ABC-type polysaccharide/polyol phosphate transport system ATPase subunit
MAATIIEAQGLSKRYRLGEGGYVTLREKLDERLRPRRPTRNAAQEIWALRDVDISIDEGEIVGIVGRNGSGKTTFLKTVARIVRPTTGSVAVRGRVGALLEVGTGFHPELTGRENVFLNGVVLGMSRREIARRFDEIVEFAGVERFLETPLKRYSSGMYLRLAFAVAAHIDPEVMIVDEVLAVGDAEFQARCLGRMSELGREGRTVLFVSHDTGIVGQLCSRAIWLDGGRVRGDGRAGEVLDRYLRTTVTSAPRIEIPMQPHNVIQNLSLGVVDAEHEQAGVLRRDEPLTFELAFSTRERVVGLDAAVYLLDRHGVRIISEYFSFSGATLAGPPQAYRLRLTIPPILSSGEYVAGLWLGNNEEVLFAGEVLRLNLLPLPTDREDHALSAVRPEVSWSSDAEVPKEPS